MSYMEDKQRFCSVQTTLCTMLVTYQGASLEIKGLIKIQVLYHEF